MIWTIIGVLLTLWILGLVAHIGGMFVHLLLLGAGIFYIAQLVSPKNSL